MTIYFIKNEIASKRARKRVQRGGYSIGERWRETSRREPRVRIRVISRKVFAQLVSIELGALNRESVLSSPRDSNQRYGPLLQCVHFCSRLYESPEGLLPSTTATLLLRFEPRSAGLVVYATISRPMQNTVRELTDLSVCWLGLFERIGKINRLT